MADREHQMMWLGNRIKQAREQAGLTQDNLADMIGVSRTAVARWEAGEIEPKIRNLVALTEQLHVSADYLLGIEESTWLDQLNLSEEARKALKAFIKEVRN